MESSSFLVKLAACFLFFLFAFHWFFGAAKSLTVTHARLIDYVYLGIAAVGVFVFALNYEEKRYEYRQAEVVDEARTALNNSRLELAKDAFEVERASCEAAIVRLMPSYCEKAKQLGSAFELGASIEKVNEAVRKYFESALPPDLTDTERSLAYLPIKEKAEGLANSLQSVKLGLMHIELQEPLPPDDIRNTTYGLFTWPFILAFAFALRIAKTTIEVLDWTTYQDPVATTSAVVPDSSAFPVGKPPPWVGRERS